MNTKIADLLEEDDELETDELGDDEPPLDPDDEDDDLQIDLDDDDDGPKLDLEADGKAKAGDPVETPAAEDEEDDDEEEADVEASLDVMLRDRFTGDGDGDEDVEEEADTGAVLVVTEEGGPRPRGADEFLCSFCFLVKNRRQLVDPARSLCVDCVDG